jgi:hypothetical protein
MDTSSVNKFEKLDAIGNPIIEGKLYGYSVSKSGWIYVTIGRAVRETTKGVTLQVVKRKRYLYGQETVETSRTSEQANATAALMFPVAEFEPNVEVVV